MGDVVLSDNGDGEGVPARALHIPLNMTYGFSSFNQTTNRSGGNWGATGVTSRGAVVKFGSHRDSSRNPVTATSLRGPQRTPYADDELERLYLEKVQAKRELSLLKVDLRNSPSYNLDQATTRNALPTQRNDVLTHFYHEHEEPEVPYEKGASLYWKALEDARWEYMEDKFYRIRIDESGKYNLFSGTGLTIYNDGTPLSIPAVDTRRYPGKLWDPQGVEVDLESGYYYVKRNSLRGYMSLFAERVGDITTGWASELDIAEEKLAQLEEDFEARRLLVSDLDSTASDSTVALAKTPTHIVQENSSDVITGDANKNKLKGTEQDDEIFGKGGNDKIKGFAGDDIIDGGKGKDKLWGGRGADVFVLSTGKDKIRDFDASEGDTLGVLKNGDYDYKFLRKGVIVLGEGSKTLVRGDTDELKQLINSMGEDLLTLM